MLEHQLPAKNPTPRLLGRPGTSNNTSTANARDATSPKMQHFKTIKLLDQDEVDAAANLLLNQIRDSDNTNENEDVVCDGEPADKNLVD